MKFRLLTLLLSLFCCSVLWADSQEDILRLEAEMLKYFSTKERSTFFSVTNELKKACKKSGDERRYYRAWGNQGIYEATQQDYPKALGIVQDIMREARENGSIYGEYSALHAEAMVLLQKQDYSAAENAFLKAVDFHHRHFPNESAGEDLQELMKIANHRKDAKAGAGYARQILREPNVAPIHKGRALYRLSQMAFKKNEVDEFNRIYQEMMLLKDTAGISPLKPIVEVNYHIVNGEFDRALSLANELDPEDCAERKAIIYHRMGDDANAFKYMQIYKQISDSITLVSHGNIVASCYVQMNNDRLQLEQYLLERENNRLLNRFYIVLTILILLVLLFFIWKSRKLVKLLRKDNKQLQYERKDAERALTDLNELSFFESKTDLPLTLAFNPNEVCDRLAASLQPRCRKGVAIIFQTELEDDFEFQTNSDALKNLLTHLLNYSARFTYKGTVKLSCADAGEFVRFTITDTSAGLGGQSKSHVIGMFSEQDNKIRYVGMNFNICQSITRLLHGRIWHDVEYTHGTRFCFELPKKPMAA